MRKHARRRLGLDIFKPVKPSIFNDDDYVITPETTALKATTSSNARAKATEIQKSKVFSKFYEISYLFGKKHNQYNSINLKYNNDNRNHFRLEQSYT